MAAKEKDAQVRELWDEFARNGVTDTLTILDYVTSVFANEQPPTLLSSPSKLLQRLNMELKLSRTDDQATFLNDYLFFVPHAQYPDGLFPLPRHLARTMAAVAGVGSGDRVLDLSCGTGGLLIAAAKAGASYLQGFDIDGRLARIAQYNVRLNAGVPQAIAQADATTLPPVAEPERPTVVLSAPPFGAPTFNRELAESVLGPISRIETGLAQQALRRLADGGRGAFLGLMRMLAGGDAGDRRLRKQVLEDYRLKGVVRLPKQALQPYSATQVYLVLIEKRRATDRDFIWFAATQRDGYGGSKSTRRLTAPPDPERNDYPLLEALLNYTATPQQHQPLPGRTDAVATVAHVAVTKGDKQPGLHVITPLSEFWLTAGRLFQDGDRKRLIVTLAGDAGRGERRHVAVWLGTEEPALEVPEAPVDAAAVLFDELIAGGAIAVSRDGVVVGVTRSQAGLVRKSDAQDADLRPETYLPLPPEGIAEQESTSELVSRLRENGRAFAASLARLIGHMDRTPLHPRTAPAVLPELSNAAFPMGRPSPVQREIWMAIQTLEREAAGRNGGAQFFTARELEKRLKDAARAELGTTLELLCRLGAIVPVTVRDTPGYRLTTTWDTWKPVIQQERSEPADAPEGTAGA